MKGDTQAAHLKRMVQKHPLFLKYDLSLPPFKIKREMIENLQKRDVILLQRDRVEMELWREGRCHACAVLAPCQKRIVLDLKHADSSERLKVGKKDDVLFCLFGTVEVREIKGDMHIDISSIDLEYVTLYIDKRAIATGHLVRVRDAVAVEIEKVIR